jgi:hypothetical protein
MPTPATDGAATPGAAPSPGTSGGETQKEQPKN